MRKYFVIYQLAYGFFDHKDGMNRNISYATAFDAAGVIMIFSHAVKASLSPGKFQFLDHAAVRENFKIPIDSAEANSWQPPPNELIDFISRGMSVHLTQLLKEHSTLLSKP